MSKRLRALLARREKTLAAARGIIDAVGSDDDVMSDEQSEQYDAHMKDVDELNAAIEKQKKLDAETDSALGVDVPDAAADAAAEVIITGGEDRRAHDPQGGFANYGDFAIAVYNAVMPQGHTDERLAIGAAAPSTYGNERSGQDGGFLVPPGFSQEIFALMLGEDAVLPLTDNDEINGNAMAYPKDETTPWGGDGIQVYWESEAAEATATKPKLGLSQLRLNKLFGLVPVTDELIEDASALTGYLTRKTGEKLSWKSNDSFYAGTGAGQPLGVLESDAKVSVAKESGQAADTVVVDNVAKMFARMPASSIRRAVWMINNDVLPQLITMKLNDEPIYTPPGKLSDSPAGSLLGRPIMLTQHAKTLGDQGDIAFVDWKMYRTITKRGGIQTATSMHLYFDAGATAFRATYRIDGQPILEKPISPANGSNDLSPFVFLDERA